MNTAISNYRRQTRQLKYEPINLIGIDKLSETLSDPQADQINFLYKAIDSLSWMDKAIILLYLEQKSYKEISQIIGISAANVGMKITRIKAKLQEKLVKITH